MGKKQSSTAVSKFSSATASATASTSTSAQKSSVLKSAFSPSYFQLHLFASVIQSFESQQLRIHDTATGRLRCQHDTKAGSRITCLDWGYYGAAYRQSQLASTKRKRKREANAGESAVVAYGTSSSDICLFSPAEGKVVASLTAAHAGGIRDFKFAPSDYLEAFSLGDDATIVQWDLTKNHPIRIISLSDGATSILARPSPSVPQILCASSAPWTVELKPNGESALEQCDAFKNQIHSLIRAGHSDPASSECFLAADSERYVNIYDISTRRLVRTLVAGSGIAALDLSSSESPTNDLLKQQVLSVLTQDGSVELFPQPFSHPSQVNGDLKTSRKNLTKKASATVRLVNPSGAKQTVPAFAASLQGPDLVLASADGGVDIAFQKLRWQDEGNGELLFSGIKEVPRTRAASSLNTATLNGAKDLGKTQVDESRTVVVNGGAGGGPVSEAIELSSSGSDAEEEQDDEDEEENSVHEPLTEALNAEAAGEGDDAEAPSDEEMADAKETQSSEHDGDETADAQAEAENEEPGEQSFGDLLASKHPNTITISDPSKQPQLSFTISNGRAIVPPGMSLGTVLTQALRTNDNAILEGCLHYTDLNVVKNTIRRIDSSLAGLLLSKLAERLASRPGRYGHLIQWVQLTCVAHGGAIAAQPDVTAKIRTLYQVLTQRAKTLDSLLLLKGKLDMLDAQLTYRKDLAAGRPQRADADEPGMIYIEGADNWDSDDDLDEDGARPSKRVKGRSKRALEDVLGEGNSDDDDEDDDEDEEMLLLENGLEDSEEGDDDDDSDEEDGGVNGVKGRLALLDDEADIASAEDSDPDDDRPNPAEDDDDSSEVEDSDEDDEDVEEDDDEEEDSEMDSFINDGSVGVASDEDDVHISGDESDDDVAPAPAPAPVAVPKSKAKAKGKDKSRAKK